MPLLSIILFFVYTWGLGFTLAGFLKESDNFFERTVARIGIGLCIIPLIGLLLSVLHIPVDWRVFAALSIIYPAYFAFRNYKNLNFKFRLKKSDLYFLFVFIVFLLSFYMYYKGSFAYPYLEDDDSWSHAVGAKYVAVEKTFFNPGGKIHYLDPYPPLYDGFFGLMHQTSPSLYWTLKFFNALVISLSILFFYLFMKELTDNYNAAVFSTVVLAMIPAYLSHFIWAHAFIPGFIFLVFYFLEKTNHDKKWILPASLAVFAVIMTSITHTIKFVMLFLIYFAVKTAVEKRFFWEAAAAGITGSALTLLWWVPLGVRYGSIAALLKANGLNPTRTTLSLDYFSSPLFYAAIFLFLTASAGAYYYLKNKLTHSQKICSSVIAAMVILLSYLLVYSKISEWGTADRIYDFNDFFIANEQNMVNNPIGIGIAVMILCFLAFFFIEFELYNSLKKAKDSMSKAKFNSFLYLIIGSSITLLVSILSFSFFRLDKNYIAQKWSLPFLKQWMLKDPDKFSYVRSFSFAEWGVYLFIFSLLAASVLYLLMIWKGYVDKKIFWVPVGLLWFTYIFAGIYDIPTQLFTFRLWMLIAFAVSILVGYSFISLSGIAGKSAIVKSALAVILIVLIFYTSGMQRYAVNTSPSWPAGGFWTSGEEIGGYVQMQANLPPNTNVFTFSNNGVVIGFDMYTCHWCKEVQDFQKNGFNLTADETYKWLKSNKYSYILFDGQTARRFGINETGSKLKGLASGGKFAPVVQNPGFILLKVN